MKVTMRNNCKQFIWTSIILVFTFGSCVKSGQSGLTVTNAVCYVSVMNQAPYSFATDIYFNGTLVSPTGGIAPEQFSAQYGAVKPGTYTIDFKKAGTDSLLFELPAMAYDTSVFYTLIFYNTAPGSAAVQATRITDDLSPITQASAFYRFFNLSPDMASVNLYLNGTAAEINRTPADNVGNLRYDEFFPLNPAVYNMQVKNTDDSVLATINSIPLSAGDVYTIFLEGTAKAGVNITVLPFAF
jgi:hypothetical protein